MWSLCITKHQRKLSIYQTSINYIIRKDQTVYSLRIFFLKIRSLIKTSLRLISIAKAIVVSRIDD